MSTRPITTRATKVRPCPVCGSGTKGCSATDDGMHLCRGEPRDGWREITRTPDDAGFRHYRRADDDRHLRNGHGPTKATKAKPPRDWEAKAREYAENLTADRRAELARLLELPVQSLDAIEQLGFTLYGYKQDERWVHAWTFPERDARGRVVGITKRFPYPVSINGGNPTNKVAMRGGKHGLYPAVGWRDRPGWVFIPEGPSDVIALSAAGLAAVGRFNNIGGAELLAEMLADLPADWVVIVMGENDRKEDGSWPGREGAEKVAAVLRARLRCRVVMAFPPEGVKDAREWVRDLAAGQGEAEDWPAIGAAIMDHCSRTAADSATGESADPFDPGITLADLLASDLPPPRFVIDGLLPEGMSILAGRPKGGKSWLAMLIAISAARGLPGLGTLVGGSRDVLHLALEDTRRRYRDRATKIIRGLGTTATVRLNVRTNWPRAGSGGLVRIAEWLKAHPGGLVVIDTLARFRDPPRGRGSSYDEDYRAIAELKALADQYDAAILVIHHTRKGAAEDPFDEVSGTLGINGAADSLMVLDRQRGANVAVLFITGRDLPDQTLDLEWAADAGLWSIVSRTDGIERPVREAGTDQGENCERWLRGLLEAHSWPDSEIVAGASRAGFSEGSVKRAKKRLRQSTPPLCSKPRGVGGAWWNWIGSKDTPKPDRPESLRREVLHEPEARQTGETGETGHG